MLSLAKAPDEVLRAMFAARKHVFIDLLKWDIPVLADIYEIDQFDSPDAAYLVLADGEHSHRASSRLLRTDRPHILGEIFACLCEEPIPVGPDIREITRFCIEPTLGRADRKIVRNQLVCALADYALATGLSAYTAVATTGWCRKIVDFGWECRPLGDARRIGSELLMALRIEIDPETPTLLAAAGIQGGGDYSVGALSPECVS